jgi:hypothetical protein
MWELSADCGSGLILLVILRGSTVATALSGQGSLSCFVPALDKDQTRSVTGQSPLPKKDPHDCSNCLQGQRANPHDVLMGEGNVRA